MPEYNLPLAYLRPVPRFVVVAEEHRATNTHTSGRDRDGLVLAINGGHFSKGWLSTGIVSFQTPYGQGTGLGVQATEVRDATWDEIRNAITSDHDHGWRFRPNCREAANASFQLVMSKVVGNWTTDGPYAGHTKPILPVSTHQILSAGEQAAQRHTQILGAWTMLVEAQRREIFTAYGERLVVDRDYRIKLARDAWFDQGTILTESNMYEFLNLIPNLLAPFGDQQFTLSDEYAASFGSYETRCAEIFRELDLPIEIDAYGRRRG